MKVKVFSLLVLLLALLSVLSGARAAPRGGIGTIRKGGKVIKKGLGVIGAIGTGHEVYQHVKDRRGWGSHSSSHAEHMNIDYNQLSISNFNNKIQK